MAPDVLSEFLEQARRAPQHIAVKDPQRELSYEALYDEVSRLATGLARSGVGEGDRVALFLPNSVEFVISALACLWIGAIFVPLAISDPLERLSTMLEDSAPAVVLRADATDGDDVAPTTIGRHSLTPFSSMLVTEEDVVAPVERRSRPAYSMYTSGTTGTPKGVLIGTTAFGAAVAATGDALGVTSETRTLCVSPFYFDGSFATLFPTLCRGGTVVIRPFSLLFSRTFFNTVLDEGITYTGFSPSFLRLLLASPQLSKLAGSTLDVIALGGEAASIADIRELWRVAPHIRVFNRYGPTETTIVVTHQQLTEALFQTGAVPIGRPHPSCSFFLVESDGSIISGVGQVGELYVSGVQLMDGYWGDADLTETVLRTDVVPGETTYRTGDLVYRDASGNYVYVDRADRVVNRHGLRISLVELSEAIRKVEGVTAVACVAFDDEGELGIVAFVTAGTLISDRELRRGAGDYLPEAMIPNRFLVVDSLPVNRSNKLDERSLLLAAGLERPRVGDLPGATRHAG